MLKYLLFAAPALATLASCDGPGIEVTSAKLAQIDRDTLRISLDLPQRSALDLIENRHVTRLGAGQCREDQMVFEDATLNGKELLSSESLAPARQYELSADFAARLFKDRPLCVLIKTVGMGPFEIYARSEMIKIPL